MAYLQSTLLPLIGTDWAKSPIPVEKFFGTAFLISNAGHAMTARHVVEKALHAASETGLAFSALVQQDDGTSPLKAIAAVLEYEFAPAPFDVAIVRLPYRARTEFRIGKREQNLWRDIATYGYPESAVSHVLSEKGFPALKLNMRANKGYIQREIAPNDMAIGDHPNGFELSFLLGPGMSGAPIFISEGPTFVTIGVGVSSIRSETTDFEHTEVDDDGKRFSERKVKIEEYGFAHSLEGLFDWSPAILGHKPLHEAWLIE